MKMIDLTMPIWDGYDPGEIVPMANTPVSFTEYMTYEQHGLRRSRIKVDDESGSPFMTPLQGLPHRVRPTSGRKYLMTVDEVPLDRLILRDTCVLTVPKGEGEGIVAADIEQALETADFRDGDAVLVRTGWGDGQKYYEMGPEYCVRTPYWEPSGSVRLAEEMTKKNCDIIMTDVGLIIDIRIQGAGWYTQKPRPRGWPSAEARDRMLDAASGVVFAPPGPSCYEPLISISIAMCKCLVNCGEISQKRVKMLILPLRVVEGGSVPARFIAIEE